MSHDDTDDQDNTDEEQTVGRERQRGIRIGLQPLTDLLGALIELDINEPSPGEEMTPRSAVTNPRRAEPRSATAQSAGGRRRRREAASDRCRIDTRLDDDTLTVVADLPGATEDDITVGIKPQTNQLVIGRNGEVVGRVDIPWESPEATRVWFNNGILEVRLSPADG
ncbi:gas vesicle protein GvpH [Halomarina litorea]|uniref:gas vesicle protein GvpH n=1 Tax=Halomarina litorea TaxID=2961595 RepID=UPI0020C5883F|nr:gas vesicle protein GvpH [Halomarina sp. BCD28]